MIRNEPRPGPERPGARHPVGDGSGAPPPSLVRPASRVPCRFRPIAGRSGVADVSPKLTGSSQDCAGSILVESSKNGNDQIRCGLVVLNGDFMRGIASKNCRGVLARLFLWNRRLAIKPGYQNKSLSFKTCAAVSNTFRRTFKYPFTRKDRRKIVQRPGRSRSTRPHAGPHNAGVS